MPVLSNSRHERFAQLLAEGKTAVDAHELAGFARNDSNSAQMAKRDDVKARVTELNGAAALQVGITLESLLHDAGEIQRAAFGSKQFAAANGALKLKAELSGHYVQRKEDVTPSRSEAEIDARLREILGTSDEVRGATAFGGTRKPSNTSQLN